MKIKMPEITVYLPYEDERALEEYGGKGGRLVRNKTILAVNDTIDLTFFPDNVKLEIVAYECGGLQKNDSGTESKVVCVATKLGAAPKPFLLRTDVNGVQGFFTFDDACIVCHISNWLAYLTHCCIEINNNYAEINRTPLMFGDSKMFQTHQKTSNYVHLTELVEAAFRKAKTQDCRELFYANVR